ncbi:hypothetical protein D9M69_500150 [compost metagenome]
MAVATGDPPTVAGFQRDEHFSAPTLHPAGTSACAGRRRQFDAQVGLRQAAAQRPNQPQRFEDLVETHRDSGGHVAREQRGLLDLEAIVGLPGVVAAQVEGLPAGAPGEARQAQLCSQFWRHAAGREEPVLQARVLVVDSPQGMDLALDGIALLAQAIPHWRRQVCRDTARHDGIHHEAVPEGLERQALPVLAQAGELRQPESQCRVVAQRAEVAQVVGHPFPFQHKCTQPLGALGDLAPVRVALPGRLERHAVRPCIGNGRVA